MSEIVPKSIYEDLQKQLEAAIIENEKLKKLANEKKYRYIFALRSRIEFLQKLLSKKLLHPIQTKMTLEETWTIILEQSTHPYTADLKRKISAQGLINKDFCEAIGILYGNGITMPYEMRKEDITKVVDILEVPSDETFVKTIDILRMQLKVNKNDTDESLKSFSEFPKKTKSIEPSVNSVYVGFRDI